MQTQAGNPPQAAEARVLVRLHLTDEEVVRLYTWVQVSRNPDPLDECQSLVIAAPWSRNTKGYLQVRGTIINERQRTMDDIGVRYRSVPTSGAKRAELPTRAGVDIYTKFQLHQLVAYHAARTDPLDEATLRLRQYFNDPTGYELSHRCHNKACTNKAHLIIETIRRNKRRNGCPVCVYINGQIYPLCTCRQIPPCLVTQYSRLRALALTVDHDDVDKHAQLPPSAEFLRRFDDEYFQGSSDSDQDD